MPAEIIDRDIQAGTEMAWHGMTKVVPVVNFGDAFPYEIEQRDIHLDDGTKWEGYYYFRCSDDGKPAGKPLPDTYKAVTNERFWEIVNNAVGGSGAIIESAGTLDNRSRRFITVRLGTNLDEFKVGDRVFKNRFSLLDSIDQSTNLYGVNSSTCVVCANTFRVVMGDRSGEFQFKLRHSKNLIPRIENMEKTIDSFVGVTAQFQKALTMANEIPVKVEDARPLFAGWLAEETNGLSTRSLNVAGRLTELFQRGAGNRGETLLDALSAVTDYYTHESSGGSEQPGFRMKQTKSSEFGAGAQAKQEFFRSIFSVEGKRDDATVSFNRDGFQSMVANGRNLIASLEAVTVN